ncbi:hypothetical protein LTR91_016230 [Friedmanniomyces endolithicus]|uniref:Crh-like protein n=1 Tax=Friedmanniomyces endolithicus TaxID=329885 RepID=A0AAN6QL16_9PEZI|nr:hypothetical protein LTR94_014038 [Friedmanniomyces endolithicus]KAK0772872.1 hypothetical protein LTR59_015490 [Friedmanniomyces endolithicus]KAK0804663.1 hypothetical protein LTR38_005768 [Friedmanniomyces endolithicus]KAK0808127.1 hypothetical protein LTR75_006404 [Friedmanniomyces endolithicus]KAK0897372.1 hypothetical protein LTR57_022138 [Friedmanniomyces endolithicus]
MHFSRTSAVLAAAAPFVAAQTSTNCDPTKHSCPADTGLNAASFMADFTQGSSANTSFSAAAYTFIDYNSQGAEFTITKAGQAPTIQTDFYIFFGRIDVKMRAAPGTGIVSSIVFLSDDLDEIDWEFLGGNTAQVETNFFGKDNTTTYDRAVYYPVSTPQASFHTYTIDWTADRIQWIIDGTTVRTLAYTDPLNNGGQNYPQTPMRLKLGNWCGGCPGEAAGTIQWAGGATTFDAAPYTMYVESVAATNYNPADSYEYSDQSGTWQSIKIVSNGVAANSSASGSGSGSGASGATTATSTGGVMVSGTGTALAAPTSSASVAGIDQQTVAAVSVTQTGASYSVNSASASAQNSGDAGGSMSGMSSASAATTEVPGGAFPTAESGSASGSGTATATGGDSSPFSSSGPASQTASSAAEARRGLGAGGSLLGVVLGFLMLV